MSNTSPEATTRLGESGVRTNKALPFRSTFQLQATIQTAENAQRDTEGDLGRALRLRKTRDEAGRGERNLSCAINLFTLFFNLGRSPEYGEFRVEDPSARANCHMSARCYIGVLMHVAPCAYTQYGPVQR